MFECPRCGCSFAQNGSLHRHLRRKKECAPIYLNIARETIVKAYSKYYNQFIVSKGNQKVTDNTKTVTESNQKITENTKTVTESNQKITENTKTVTGMESIYQCNYCGKNFSHKKSVSRHISKRCKVKQQEVENEKIQELTKKVEELEKKLQDQRPIIQNTTINNNLDQSVNTINFILNDYGNEKINFSSQEKMEILNHRYRALPEIINQIYIKTPENRNVYIPSTKNKYGYVYKQDNDIWDVRLVNNIVDEVYLKGNNLIYKFLTTLDLNSELKLIIDKVTTNYDRDNDTIHKYKNEIKEDFMNNSKMIKKYYENKLGRKMILAAS